jgi:hypothetical protein
MGFKFRLNRLLAREQISFIRRPRKHWGAHLALAREFIGSALKSADPARPTLILGAGPGLEIPWRLAPVNTFAWDAAPLSRLGTFIRHRRWPQWVFKDITSAFEGLDVVSRRVQIMEGRWALRPVYKAARRLAGLLPSVPHSPKALDAWIEEYCPGTIICANVLGQIKPLAYRIVELAFKPRNPWVDDQDLVDPLQDALEIWISKLLASILNSLRKSGSNLYLLHDKGVIHQDADIALGDWTDSWLEQLKTMEKNLDVSDPWSGVDVLTELNSLNCLAKNRWIWPVGPAQIHIVEALAYCQKTL